MWKPQHIVMSIAEIPGSGKTTFLSGTGYNNYLLGRKIFTNFHVEYPHHYVESKEELYKMRNGIFLGDELWRWLFSRRAMYKQHQEIIMDFIENIRKRGIHLLYTGHSDDTIDKIVRIITSYYGVPRIRPRIRVNREVIKKQYNDDEIRMEIYKLLKKYVTRPEFYEVSMDILKKDKFNDYIFLKNVEMENIKFWGDMFNTHEEVDELKLVTQERKGVSMERKLKKALLEYIEKRYIYLIPNSGLHSPFPGDLIVKKNLINIKGVQPVKGNNATYWKLDLRGYWEPYFECENKFGFKPWIAFQNGNWKFIPITKESDIIKYKAGTSLSQIKNTIELKAFCERINRE